MSDGDITNLLHRWRSGDAEAEAHLFELVKPDLIKLAKSYVRRERPGHTIQSMDLFQETFLTLHRAKEIDWRDRHHFFAFTARAMRRFLIDYARQRKGFKVPLDDFDVIAKDADMELAVEIDRLLQNLEKEDSEQSALVELKFFLGLTDSEAADALQIPLRTAQRRWREARKWLFARLESRGWMRKAANATNNS